MPGLTATALAAASVYSIYKSATQHTDAPPALPAMPTVPADVDPLAGNKAGAVQRKKTANAPGRASTILTGNAGLSTPAAVARKTLLGQ